MQDQIHPSPPDISQIIFLHEKLAKRKCDRFLLNLALAYHQMGHKVVLYTSQYNRSETIDDFKFLDKIKIRYSGWWIPNSLFGIFRGKMSILKSICLALRMVFSRQKNASNLIILDTSIIALYILNLFTHNRLLYVESFEQLRNQADFCEHSTYSPSLLEAKFIKLADEIVVESDGFAEVFKRSFPAVAKEPVIIYPAIDIGLWNEDGIKIQRIIPDLMDNTVVFLSIGKYKRSTNFKLALNAFEILLQLIADIETTKCFQLVIAGNCKTLEEKLYYQEMVSTTKERKCASQVSFLNKLPIIHEKTLIMGAAVAIHPSKSDLQADFILKAMSLGKPIVATTKGIAPQLLQNKVSGITTEPDPNAMAQVLRKLMMSPHLQSFIGDVAKEVFQKNYSFKSFCSKLSEITFKHGIEAAPSIKTLKAKEA
ncbi:alpha-1,3/1,6-mannosyltransferase ALG2 isoform X1 [Dendroctonus ponderosae]|uniref:Alpha-1,3/1,6-mannosyltransferase ALG2 n=2 Tax=Dendroctonus ponderosae TaxID=77166 RepID=A0AAR5QCJ6_DENPD|nr:alpha-1,3/1,6-mannosyltransferase ALG2 isoform X1 [Dendroctonus ponderosae]KAH1003578.1 hypothetical protein HUJ04_003479 [Dendroctonus ponderosae]KAH1010127.1 hypothetical protein HUJ05_004478 [Dendroctonus ponderosae]